MDFILTDVSVLALSGRSLFIYHYSSIVVYTAYPCRNPRFEAVNALDNGLFLEAHKAPYGYPVIFPCRNQPPSPLTLFFVGHVIIAYW